MFGAGQFWCEWACGVAEHPVIRVQRAIATDLQYMLRKYSRLPFALWCIGRSAPCNTQIISITGTRSAGNVSRALVMQLRNVVIA